MSVVKNRNHAYSFQMEPLYTNMQWVHTILKVFHSDFIIFPLDFLFEREKSVQGMQKMIPLVQNL